MAGNKPEVAEDLTAYERWELPAFGGASPNERQSLVKKKSEPKVKLPTAADIEKIRQAAYNEGQEEGRKSGYQDGFAKGVADGIEQGKAQGLTQGLEAGKTQVAAKTSELSTLLTQLANPMKVQEEMLAQALLNTSVAIARSVIHKELETNSDVIQNLVKETMMVLDDQSRDLTLRLNPADIELVSAAIDSNTAITLEPDPSVIKGGCLLESSSQLIDFTVEKRFQKIIQAMLTKFAQSKTEQDAALSPISNTSELTDYSHDVLSEHDDSVAEYSAGENESAVEQKEEESEPQVDDADDIAMKGDEPSDSSETLSDKAHKNGVQDMAQEDLTKDSLSSESLSKQSDSNDLPPSGEEG